MRKLLAVVMIAGLTSTSFAQFSKTSMRMNGINPNLVGIVTDEYSDALSVNTADALNIKGWRVYTNLSNLNDNNVGTDKTLSANPPAAGAGVPSFLLGGFGNPFSKLIQGQMGFFYDATGGITTPAANQLGGFGDSFSYITTQTDVTGNGAVTDPTDTKSTVSQTAKRQIDSGYSSLNALYARQTKLLGGTEIGFTVSYMSAADAGAAGLKSTSDEPIEAAYNRTFFTYGTPNVTKTEDQSQIAKETYKNSTLNIGVGGRHDISDKMDVGVTLGLTPVTIKQSRDSQVRIQINNNTGLANPISADVTMVDGTQDGSGFGATTGAGTVSIPAGFSWTSTQFMGPNNEMNIANVGMTGNEIGSYKTEGNQFGFSADTHYLLNNRVKLVGRINVSSLPGTLSASMSLPYHEVLRGVGANGFLGGGDDGGADMNITDTQTTYGISGGKWNKDTFGFTAGGEAKLKQNVLIGFGLNYSMNSIETKYNWAKNDSNVAIYDVAGNGFENTIASGDIRTTVTSSNSGTVKQKTETNTLQIPIGFELRPWPKFPVRLGVTHQIARTKTTNNTTIVDEGRIATKTEVANTDTTIYTDPTKTTGREAKVVTTRETRTTDFFYGMGYNWSENLTFDILGMASSANGNILDLASWRIGATLIF